MAQADVHYELQDAVAVVRLDDGKANALSPARIDALQAALDRAEKQAKAVLILGRPGRFSGGFDLDAMRAGADSARELVRSGAELFLRMFAFPCPVVAACTGHAVAAGAIVLLVADARLGAEGEFKIGLSEVGIGMTLPIFAIELARHRLSKRHLARATLQAELYAPMTAVDAGFLDRATPAATLFETALAEATRLGQLPQPAFRNTKAKVRAATIGYIRETLEADLEHVTGLVAG